MPACAGQIHFIIYPPYTRFRFLPLRDARLFHKGVKTGHQVLGIGASLAIPNYCVIHTGDRHNLFTAGCDENLIRMVQPFHREGVHFHRILCTRQFQHHIMALSARFHVPR
jgi:hypothetical protein